MNSVVKPPIDLEINLSHIIELKFIKIWPQINSLKSIGFEIHISDELKAKYYKVASHFNLQEHGIQFINKFTDNVNKDCIDTNFAVTPFYSFTKNHLRKVKNIKLVIKQTARCVPVIKRIEGEI